MGNTPDSLTLIAHETDKVVGNTSYAINGFRAMTGLQGFRSYSWMTDTAATNAVGNFRGMVISARWASAYNVISPIAKVAENLATVASLAGNIMDMAPQFEKVYRSNSNAAVKAQQISLLTSVVAQKTLAGIITGGVHLIYLPLILSCGAAARTGGRIGAAANVCSTVVGTADALVQSSANYLTNPANQQRVIQSLVTIRIN
jgi:hypothetical protein